MAARLLLIAALAVTSLVAAAPASAQTDAAAPDAPACAYDDCALRVEPGFWGARLVQGRDGVTVDRDGFFGGMNLKAAVGEAPLAVEHAERYSDARFQALLASAGALALMTSLDFTASTDEGRAGIGFAVIGLAIYGTVNALRAQREQARAVWEYNATLDR